jgi:hypothetical protein
MHNSFWYCNYVNTFVTLTRFINYNDGLSLTEQTVYVHPKKGGGVIQILLDALHHCCTHSCKRS